MLSYAGVGPSRVTSSCTSSPPPRPWRRGWPAASETLVVNYHNITPPELMAPWDNHLALGQLRAQGDLRLLAPRTVLAVADSAYNEAHLAQAGFAATAVIAPSAALDAAGAGLGRPATARGRRTPWRSQLAGRRAGVAEQGPGEHRRRPRRGPRPTATREPRSTSSGKPATDSYVAALHRYVAELGLADAVRFTGPRRATPPWRRRTPRPTCWW